jgi:hypothetical protein
MAKKDVAKPNGTAENRLFTAMEGDRGDAVTDPRAAKPQRTGGAVDPAPTRTEIARSQQVRGQRGRCHVFSLVDTTTVDQISDRLPGLFLVTRKRWPLFAELLIVLAKLPGIRGGTLPQPRLLTEVSLPKLILPLPILALQVLPGIQLSTLLPLFPARLFFLVPTLLHHPLLLLIFGPTQQLLRRLLLHLPPLAAQAVILIALLTADHPPALLALPFLPLLPDRLLPAFFQFQLPTLLFLASVQGVAVTLQ